MSTLSNALTSAGIVSLPAAVPAATSYADATPIYELKAQAKAKASKTVTLAGPAKPAKPTLIGATLLETVRALDGNKEDRYTVAHAALTVAYTQALQHGNKTHLTAVIESDGRKACERGMRTAVQVVGVPVLHKDAATRADTIDYYVMQALDIFAGIACKEPVKAKAKAKAKTKTVAAPAEPVEPVAAEPVALNVSDMVAQIVALIGTGALSADDVDALETACIGARMHAIAATQAVETVAH